MEKNLSEEKIKRLNGYKGQLVKIQQELETELTSDEYHGLCDDIANINTYISIVIKDIKDFNKSKTNALPKNSK